MTEYAPESPVSLRRRRQRRRALIVIGTVLLGLFFAFWYALSYYQQGQTSQGASAAGPTCQPADPDVPAPEQISVTVLNSSNRTGLAAATARQLGQLGFTIVDAANDKTGRDAPSVAELRYGEGGRPGALVLRDYLPSGTKMHKDKREDDSIDLALGAKFSSPVAPKPSPGALPTCPVPNPS